MKRQIESFLKAPKTTSSGGLTPSANSKRRTVTGRLPARETIRANLQALGFFPNDLNAQALYTAFSTEIREYRAAIQKGEGTIRRSGAHKHHPILEGKTLQEMWETLKERFQHVSPINTSRKILDTVKIKLSDCKDMHKYTSAYQEAYDYVCNLTTANSDYQQRELA